MTINFYPNPFKDVAIFEYELEKSGLVTLKIFNHLGQEIMMLVNEKQAAGKQQVSWNAKNFPAGIYSYRFQADNQAGTGKMILMK